jgi:ABC-type branched-subunit amino acid transport system ATPase component
MDGPLLVCDGVSKHYGSLKAVDRLSLVLEPGEVLGIGGPNGAGKTTLFDVITGIAPATEGRVIVQGVDVTQSTPDRICQLGMVRTFQLNAAFDSLSVRDNVQLAAYFGKARKGLPTFRFGPDALGRTERALELLGLQQSAGRPAGELPVLERKLLMIASAVATDPRIILLDEPVGGLNPHEIDRIVDVVEKLRASGLTVVLIEHVMRFLLQLSTRVMIMHQGRAIYEGPPRGVPEDPKVVETYLGAATTRRLQRFFEGAAGHG